MPSFNEPDTLWDEPINRSQDTYEADGLWDEPHSVPKPYMMKCWAFSVHGEFSPYLFVVAETESKAYQKIWTKYPSGITKIYPFPGGWGTDLLKPISAKELEG